MSGERIVEGMKHFKTPIHLQLKERVCRHPLPKDARLTDTTTTSISSSKRAGAQVHSFGQNMKTPQTERNTLSIPDFPFNIHELTNNNEGSTITRVRHHFSAATIGLPDLEKSCAHGD